MLMTMTMLSFSNLMVVVHGWINHNNHPRHIPTKSRAVASISATRLWVSQSPNDGSPNSMNDDDDDDYDADVHEKADPKMDNKNHMSIVRSLQNAYYKTAASTPPCQLDLKRGLVWNLPILTWPWHELPGRTNVLHVHEGTYTHLLETVLRSNPPVWYLGHVYRKKQGTPQAQQQQQKQQCNLVSWQDHFPSTSASSTSASASLLYTALGDPVMTDTGNNEASQETVLGTLLRITDYRRMADGRLLVLVQALERIVVYKVTQTAPYSVAHVQLLPDYDSIEKQQPRQQHNEKREGQEDGRLKYLQESFGKWHRYEFEFTQLPLPLTKKKRGNSNPNRNNNNNNNINEEPQVDDHDDEHYLDNSQIVGSALAQVLPYAAFSSVVNVTGLQHQQPHLSSLTPTTTRTPTNAADENVVPNAAAENDDYKNSTLNLYDELINRKHLLREPPISLDADLPKMTLDDLEWSLWIYLDRYLKQTKKTVSPILLGLLPPPSSSSSHGANKWPNSFALENKVQAILQEQQDQLHHKCVRVSMDYPPLRRQNRLSYAAAALLESSSQDQDNDQTQTWRYVLLQIPTCKQRLALVVQMLRAKVEGGAFQ